MSIPVLFSVLLGFLVTPSFRNFQVEPTDQQIVAMGHGAWIAWVRERGDTPERLTDAERRFALALGICKRNRIAESADRRALDELDILLANITKGACRLADHSVEGTPNERLYNAKATTAMVLTMDSIVEKRQAGPGPVQADVWRAYREVQGVHRQNHDKLEEYGRRTAGYTAAQHGHEYGALGRHIDRAFKLAARRSMSDRAHLFSLFERLIRLTVGVDPLPYQAPATSPRFRP